VGLQCSPQAVVNVTAGEIVPMDGDSIVAGPGGHEVIQKLI
jgi:hypothetical protein